MIAAIALDPAYCMAGLWLSYKINIVSGAAIEIFSVLCYLIIYGLAGLIARCRRVGALCGE